MDSTLLFQRLIRIAEHSPESLEDAFAFELCSVPASLFDTSCLPRHPNKSSLANNIWNEVKLTSAEIPTEALNYVFDGGSLLHYVPLSKVKIIANLHRATYNMLSGDLRAMSARLFLMVIERLCQQRMQLILEGQDSVYPHQILHLKRT